ncbi:hypothetical protein ACWDBO_31700 [Streptomyces mirabilis]|uniref:hypothetical protein n=1 Tax=Streptomyces mirabilis TaxID=68239 RepID=UPI00331D8C1B
MATIDFPDHLIALERSAWAEIQRGELTVETARAVHEAVVAFAAESGLARLDVEMGLKKAVRHPDPELAA